FGECPLFTFPGPFVRGCRSQPVPFPRGLVVRLGCPGTLGVSPRTLFRRLCSRSQFRPRVLTTVLRGFGQQVVRGGLLVQRTGPQFREFGESFLGTASFGSIPAALPTGRFGCLGACLDRIGTVFCRAGPFTLRVVAALP